MGDWVHVGAHLVRCLLMFVFVVKRTKRRILNPTFLGDLPYGRHDRAFEGRRAAFGRRLQVMRESVFEEPMAFRRFRCGVGAHMF